MGQQTATTAAIAAMAAITAALITALASVFSARHTSRHKIRELELSYEQKLKESFRANARERLDSLYIPLNIALSELMEGYLQFRPSIDPQTRTASDADRERFIAVCQKFLRHTTELGRRGSDVFLIPQLDTELQTFTSFLKLSLYALPLRFLGWS